MDIFYFLKSQFFFVKSKSFNSAPLVILSTSIEHLSPQSKGDEAIVGNIGNLILVDKITNGAELKDFDFTKKIEILKNKKYPLDDYLLSVNQWTEKEVKERGKVMAHNAYHKIWCL